MGDQEDFSQLPLPDQFAHKNWKARKAGYETAAKEFKTAQLSAPIVREFTDGNLWKGAVSDSNVAAQQEALAAYNAFLEASGTDGARRTRTHTVGGIVEKGLIGRPAAKQSAQDALLLLIELDKADPIIEELLPFLTHKLPKLVAATLGALTVIIHAYGCKVVEPKPVIKQLPKIYGHADKNVRAEGQNLTVELYRWLREAMKPLFWGELKEVQQKDLEKLFEPIKAEAMPKQERLLLSQQAAKEEAETSATGAGAAGEGEDEEDGGAIDLEPEYEAVDVLAKVPKDFGERLASAKWKDRKEALDDLFTAASVPAIQEGPYDEIMRGLAKSMKDANIAVVTVAANCVECLAKGLRKSFGKYRNTILTPMLERFKEKKQSVTDALSTACDAVFASTSLGDIQVEVLEALKNKNPQIKEQSAKFLTRSLKTTREAPSPEQTKEIAEAAKKLLTESVATLRDVGAEILGVLWKIMGDRNMLAHLDGLDEIRKTKVKEFSDAADVKAKWKPKVAAPAPKAAAPIGKKPALGTKRPAPSSTKRPAAPRPASPGFTDDAPLQPTASSRPSVKPPGAAPALRPPGGLKAPGSGLQKPGSGLKAPSSTASPRRPQSSAIDDAPPSTAPKSALSAPGRGLAGRPLGKPLSAAPSSPPPSISHTYTSPSQHPALISIERQELSELRSSVELLQQQNSDLRTDKLRLTSQITELQNQNAQLIEDHTRDVLQIKAKETQLVRARSDAENAEERANSLSKEIDRLKREMSRLGRVRANSAEAGLLAGTDDSAAAAASPPPPSAPTSGARPGYHHSSSRSYHIPSTTRTYSHTSGVNGNGGSIDGGEEGKENLLPGDHGVGTQRVNAAGGRAKLSSPVSGFSSSITQQQQPYSRPMSHASSGSGRATPGAGDEGGAAGVESWRRAAEVTQNLKARIEMMKARQNIGRGQ